MVKECTKCGEEKPVTEYHKQKRGKYGVTAQCKECKRASGREYAQRPETKERRKEHERKPEVRERRREYQREYQRRPEMREKKREYMSEYMKRSYVLDQKRERGREDKLKLRAMGILSNQHFEIAKKHATRSGRWSDAEIEFLMSSELPLVDIALELGRTYSSVQLKRWKVCKQFIANTPS